MYLSPTILVSRLKLELLIRLLLRVTHSVQLCRNWRDVSELIAMARSVTVGNCDKGEK